MIKNSADQVARARISMIGKMGLSQDFFDTEPNFVNLKAAIRGILDAPRSDFNRKNLTKVIKTLRIHKISPIIRTVTSMDATVLTTNGSTSPAIDAEIVVNNIVARMGLLSENRKIRGHAAVINRLDQWIGNLNAPC
ncbi:hypothetical protein BELL_0387g00010 [Botrytis elliptica]|uniref:Uncharacterized protein n=1 Tax=Botrytis elliptica TaxID=278938 RepID=A0A4Z1JW40_9HELO|nr:hypothetical protein BELL_0387g00010 [Botrytis elliptica]